MYTIMRQYLLSGLLMLSVTLCAQTSAFDAFRKQQAEQFNKFKSDKQAEYDTFRRRANEHYAQFMRNPWAPFDEHEADQAVAEPTLPPVVCEERQTTATVPTAAVAVSEEVEVIPPPEPAPEPIAPVQPKENPTKRVSISYFGTIISIVFPADDSLHLDALDEEAIADAWTVLSDSRYDATVASALNARKANALCDWSYLKMLQAVTEKHYGKTNEAVLMQAFLMTQAGYRIRLGMSTEKLYMLVASRYDIFNFKYFVIDKTKFYNVSGERIGKMFICEAKFDQEKSLSLQIRQLPQLGNEPTPKRVLTSRKGLSSVVSLNQNLIDFFNSYPQACYNGNQATRWVAYANTPLEDNVKAMLYPPLKSAIQGMNEREAVGLLLNWVQTSFEYKLDDEVWGGDRAFFAQETLFYPYCDCEDRSILFSRLVRDLLGLDVVFMYYPGHLATAVAFSEEGPGDWLLYKNRKYIVCDPTYINAAVGRTMPGCSNQEAQIIALH